MWILQNSLLLGTAIGALVAGKFMYIGRRTVMLAACIIGVIGAAMTLCLDLTCMIQARVILGLAIGLTVVPMIRYIQEYVPHKMFGICATILFTAIVLGIYLGNVIAYILPDDAVERDYFEDYEIWKVMGGTFTKRSSPPRNGEVTLRNNQTWRFLFSVPLVLYIIQLLCLSLLHSYETPKWYLFNGDESSAILAVHQIYYTQNNKGAASKIC